MSERDGNYKLHIKHETKTATLIAALSSLAGYFLAALAVYKMLHQDTVLGFALIFFGCLIIAAGGAIAELTDQFIKSKKADKEKKD